MRGRWKDEILRKATSQFGNSFELAESEFQFLPAALGFDIDNISTQSNDNHRENSQYVIILKPAAIQYVNL